MRAMMAAVLLLLLAACAVPPVPPTTAASPPLSPSGPSPPTPPVVAPTSSGDTPSTLELNVTASQFSFDPGTITVKKGTRLIIHLTSADVRHGFGILEYGQNVQFDKGEVKTVDFVADKAGTFTFHCTVPCGPGHQEMQGTLIVQ